MEFLTSLSWPEIAGIAALWIIGFDRLAKITPTEVDNKIAAKMLTVLYSVFAVLGLKVPDIK